MTFRPTRRACRCLLRVAVAGAVATGAQFGLAGIANADGSIWDHIAECESGGNWKSSSRSGYSGGLQIDYRTWRAYGGSGTPNRASRAQQIAVAKRIVAAEGWKAWPACSRRMGMR